MTAIKIDASAANKLAAEVSAQRKLIPPAVIKVVQQHAEIMRAQAQAAAPVTNRVPGYPGTIKKKVKASMMGAEAEIFTSSPFGFILEFGAGYSGPHPHFGPAFNSGQGPFESAVAAVAAKFL